MSYTFWALSTSLVLAGVTSILAIYTTANINILSASILISQLALLSSVFWFLSLLGLGKVSSHSFYADGKLSLLIGIPITAVLTIIFTGILAYISGTSILGSLIAIPITIIIIGLCGGLAL